MSSSDVALSLGVTAAALQRSRIEARERADYARREAEHRTTPKSERPLCGARTRADGHPCRARAYWDPLTDTAYSRKGRCRMHGGATAKMWREKTGKSSAAPRVRARKLPKPPVSKPISAQTLGSGSRRSGPTKTEQRRAEQRARAVARDAERAPRRAARAARVAAWYAERERRRLQREARRARGKGGRREPPGGKPPLGWRYREAGAPGELVPDAAEQKTLRVVATLLCRGYSLRKIALTLNAMHDVHPPRGARWHFSTLRRSATRLRELGLVPDIAVCIDGSDE